MPVAYPTASRERDQWIFGLRGERNKLDPYQPYAFMVEEECNETGQSSPMATVFLTNRECPWRCLMCDLWRNTLVETVPVGAIPAQIDYALTRLPKTDRIKLYNSGSFFDRRAIPTEDLPVIAGQVRSFKRVIVECHPSLIGESSLRFRNLLDGQFEVALGLETVHEEVLDRLNKRMSLDLYSRAVTFLRTNGISVRTFVLIKPPFVIGESEALYWAQRSLDFAFNLGVEVVSLIPTRMGNGAVDQLMSAGQFTPPKLETLEAAFDYGIGLNQGRVFADLWDLERFSTCSHCYPVRAKRLNEMNLYQRKLPRVECHACKAI